MDHQAIIVGGGIGGLTAANALQRIGIDVGVYERAPELAEVGAGLTLWGNATGILAQLGLGDELDSASVVMRRAVLTNHRGRLIADLDVAGMAVNGAQTVGVHRAGLQQLLHAPVAGRVNLGTSCTGYAQDADGVTMTTGDGRRIRAAWLVGADGIHSAAREQMRGPETPRYAGYTAWRAIVPWEIDEPNTTRMMLGPGIQFGIVPTAPGEVYWFSTWNTAQGGADPPDGAKDRLLELVGDWVDPIRPLIEATPESAILRNDIIDRAPVTTWGEGRVTLLGDAAHATTPNLGQGACQAIEDAAVLANCLAPDGAVTPALRRYESLRIPRANRITVDSWRIGKLYQLESGVGRWIRDMMFVCAPQWLMNRQHRRTLGTGITLLSSAR